MLFWFFFLAIVVETCCKMYLFSKFYLSSHLGIWTAGEITHWVSICHTTCEDQCLGPQNLCKSWKVLWILVILGQNVNKVIYSTTWLDGLDELVVPVSSEIPKLHKLSGEKSREIADGNFHFSQACTPRYMYWKTFNGLKHMQMQTYTCMYTVTQIYTHKMLCIWDRNVLSWSQSQGLRKFLETLHNIQG